MYEFLSEYGLAALTEPGAHSPYIYAVSQLYHGHGGATEGRQEQPVPSNDGMPPYMER